MLDPALVRRAAPFACKVAWCRRAARASLARQPNCFCSSFRDVTRVHYDDGTAEPAVSERARACVRA